ncbi:MAG: hypothetical protein HYV04_16745 [Deltaproteobacteria bacterium]|nr:hypothetical protein [Deltaproteobacteria bacterium]
MYAAVILIASFFFTGSRGAVAGEFPPFVPWPERLPIEIQSEVMSVWSRHTFARAVNGQPAHAPLDLFRLFVDLPEVTVAAARHLGFGDYTVRQLGSASYQVEDSEGARGTYRVLAQDAHRRLILASGSRPGWIFGRIEGASLTLLTFSPEPSADGRPRVAQRLETLVRIDNRVAAFSIRILLPIFSRYADRKIAEGFSITARVSSWAHENPKTFCRWFSRQTKGAFYRTELAAYCSRA